MGRREKERNIFYIIDTILLIILITLVLYVKIEGAYINTEIRTIEVCNKEPTIQGLQTLQEIGYEINNYTVIKTATGEKIEEETK